MDRQRRRTFREKIYRVSGKKFRNKLYSEKVFPDEISEINLNNREKDVRKVRKLIVVYSKTVYYVK